MYTWPHSPLLCPMNVRAHAHIGMVRDYTCMVQQLASDLR